MEKCAFRLLRQLICWFYVSCWWLGLHYNVLDCHEALTSQQGSRLSQHFWRASFYSRHKGSHK